MNLHNSPARRGLEWLLGRHPGFEVLLVDYGRSRLELELGNGITPAEAWIRVELGQPSDDGLGAFAVHPYAIWKNTGAVHGIRDGAVIDPPLWQPGAVDVPRARGLAEALTEYPATHDLGAAILEALGGET